jgi:hypothetical protein
LSTTDSSNQITADLTILKSEQQRKQFKAPFANQRHDAHATSPARSIPPTRMATS